MTKIDIVAEISSVRLTAAMLRHPAILSQLNEKDAKVLLTADRHLRDYARFLSRSAN